MRTGDANPDLPCPVCGKAMTARKPDWWHVCECGMEASTLAPRIHDPSLDPVFDWQQRVQALSHLRKQNAQRILDRIEQEVAPPARLLDVGCASGWFLEAAQARGYQVCGIEPDPRMAAACDPALGIRGGLFPEALDGGERFDILTFNDVFEHLPDVQAAMNACVRHLAEDGVLVINLPNARGGIYRLSRAAAALGIPGPFERMWQKDYPSPHLTYFMPSTLKRLADSAGLIEQARFPLPAITASGLWARVRYDRTRSLAYAVAAWAVVLAALPLLAVLPSDISVQIFGRPRDSKAD